VATASADDDRAKAFGELIVALGVCMSAAGHDEVCPPLVIAAAPERTSFGF
jgi:hypothetical protein